jgi:hypothetical protein
LVVRSVFVVTSIELCTSIEFFSLMSNYNHSHLSDILGPGRR